MQFVRHAYMIFMHARAEDMCNLCVFVIQCCKLILCATLLCKIKNFWVSKSDISQQQKKTKLIWTNEADESSLGWVYEKLGHIFLFISTQMQIYVHFICIFWVNLYLSRTVTSTSFLPFTPTSDQDRISPYNIYTISSRQVMRIEKNINYGIISWSNTKFSELTS